MTLLNDRQIRRLCTVPTFWIHDKEDPSKDPEPMSQPFTQAEYKLVEAYNNRSKGGVDLNRYYLTNADIAPDKYKGMIEPFSPNLVKELCGEKVISYGLSSFGYDVTIAPHFKIASNLTEGILDPKNLDERKFVDHDGDYVIIPPMSFVLTHTKEYFRMPKDVKGLVLTKSTYARCFTPDTKVALVDGTSASFKELEDGMKTGKRYWGYSIDEKGSIKVSELTNSRKIGHEKIIEVELDNGEKIRCTPDHKFLNRDGDWVEAGSLTPGSSLMPLYRVTTRGYEAVVQPLTFTMTSTHWLSDGWNLRHGTYLPGEREHRHHKDHDRRNNNPTNIERKDASEHLSEHNAEYWSNEENKLAHSALLVAAHKELLKDPVWSEEQRQRSIKGGRALWDLPEHEDARRKINESRITEHTAEAREKISSAKIAFYSDVSKREEQRLRMRLVFQEPKLKVARARMNYERQARKDITEETLTEALETAGTVNGAAKLLKCDRSVFLRFKDVILRFKEKWELAKITQEQMLVELRKHGSITKVARALKMSRATIVKNYRAAVEQYYDSPVGVNHTVVAVKEIEETSDVYCLTVPEFGNFALESGVFVKNCGLVCVTTQINPGWEGQLVLEYFNATPVPAKLYAHEGGAEIMFLRGDAPEAPYDTTGKYQGQKGITLPKM